MKKYYLTILSFLIVACSDPSSKIASIEIDESMLFNDSFNVVVKSKINEDLIIYELIANDGDCSNIILQKSSLYGTKGNVKDSTRSRFSQGFRQLGKGASAGYQVSTCKLRNILLKTNHGDIYKEV